MNATVQPNPLTGGFLAWCEACHDGVNAGKVKANKWAAAHNLQHHPEGNTS